MVLVNIGGLEEKGAGAHMQKIPLKRALPGMKLAKPVVNENGVVLIGAGIELTEGIIHTLERKEIDRVVVEGSPLGEIVRPPEERIDELNVRFSNVGDNPVMMHIKELFVRRILKKAEEKAEGEEGGAGGGNGGEGGGGGG